MMFLSQLLNKPVYFEGKKIGKMIDMAVFENRSHPPVSKYEIQTVKKKITVSPKAVEFKDNRFTLLTHDIPLLPYDNQDFYLHDDLLDKQVIDTNGKRLVRVNDVVLDDGEEIKVIGIDVGSGGLMRRVGLGIFASQPKIIPWVFIEAFDYDTGNIRIKLTQHNLQSLHPADIADILEEAGTKERLGILTSLDEKQAARAIAKSDEQTQASIIEELATTPFINIINKMRSSELADVFHLLDPEKTKEIQKLLDKEKAQKIKNAMSYPDDVAGGLMRLTFYSSNGDFTVKETMKMLASRPSVKETLIVVNNDNKLYGVINTKDLINTDSLALLKDIIAEKKFVYADVHFSKIIKLFAQYGLRALPVVDKDKKLIGVIVIDDILQILDSNDDRYENH